MALQHYIVAMGMVHKCTTGWTAWRLYVLDYLFSPCISHPPVGPHASVSAAVSTTPARILGPLISELQVAAGTVSGTLKTIQVCAAAAKLRVFSAARVGCPLPVCVCCVVLCVCSTAIVYMVYDRT